MRACMVVSGREQRLQARPRSHDYARQPHQTHTNLTVDAKWLVHGPNNHLALKYLSSAAFGA